MEELLEQQEQEPLEKRLMTVEELKPIFDEAVRQNAEQEKQPRFSFKANPANVFDMIYDLGGNQSLTRKLGRVTKTKAEELCADFVKEALNKKDVIASDED